MVQEVVSGLTTKSLMAFGLPSVIVQVLVPKLVNFIQQHPRGARLLTYLMAFLSVCGTLTFGVIPLFQKFVWNWLPQVQLQSGDLLYEYLRRRIHAKAYSTVPNILRASADTANATEAGNPCYLDDEYESDDGGNLEGTATCGEDPDITYRNPSSRVFFHEGTLFALETPIDSDESHYLAIRAFAFTHKPIKLLLKDAWTKYLLEAKETTTAVYKPRLRYNTKWVLSKYKEIRQLKTVDIDEAQKEKIIGDITKYVSPYTKAWYRKRGIPCRRGYLFHGPPGTGKSSLAAAIAGHFRTRLYAVSMNDRGINDEALLTLLNKMRKGSVL